MCESLEYNKWGEYGVNDNSVSLWRYGLGVNKGSFNLTLGNNPGGSSFFEDRLAKKFRRTIPVEVTTLDTVAINHGWLDRKISLMKLDVEGYEPYVFEGGKRLLNDGHVEHLLMESSVTDITEGKFPSQDWFCKSIYSVIFILIFCLVHDCFYKSHFQVEKMIDILYSAGFRVKGIYSVNGEPYHEDWWPTFNVDFEKRHNGVTESSDQTIFLAKVTCNILWINSKYIKAQ
jgi:FkbM family methyltransferase